MSANQNGGMLDLVWTTDADLFDSFGTEKLENFHAVFNSPIDLHVETKVRKQSSQPT